MKDVSFVLSESDVSIVLFTLYIFPAYDFLLHQKYDSYHTKCCLSAYQKIAEQTPKKLTVEEYHIISSALEVARLIAQQSIKSDTETTRTCSNNLHSINELSLKFKNFFH